jgi:hypothetical protein
VPDLGQVSELDPGIMALGFEPMITVPGGDRVEADQQVRAVPVPGAVCAGWSWSCALLVALRLGPGAAVADGVPVLVGHGHAPRGLRVLGGRRGQVAGQGGVDRGGTRDEIRSFRERARAAHDYSADISDKVQRGRQRWAGARILEIAARRGSTA